MEPKTTWEHTDVIHVKRIKWERNKCGYVTLNRPKSEKGRQQCNSPQRGWTSAGVCRWAGGSSPGPGWSLDRSGSSGTTARRAAAPSTTQAFVKLLQMVRVMVTSSFVLPLLTEGWRRQSRRRRPCRPASGGTSWCLGRSRSSAPCLSESHQTSPATNQGTRAKTESGQGPITSFWPNNYLKPNMSATGTI